MTGFSDAELPEGRAAPETVEVWELTDGRAGERRTDKRSAEVVDTRGRTSEPKLTAAGADVRFVERNRVEDRAGPRVIAGAELRGAAPGVGAADSAALRITDAVRNRTAALLATDRIAVTAEC
jgi:hypothetical protein